MQKSKAVPEGYSTVSPYLIIESVEDQIAFLKKVFNAQVKMEMKQPDGYIGHGEVCIGEDVIMMGRASKDYPKRINMIHVYVDNPDEAFNIAIKNGALSVREPADQPYGDRSGGFTDPQGNEWWVACSLNRAK